MTVPSLKDQRLLLLFLYWLILAAIVLVCDYNMGPFIQFPFLFILPVVLATWYNGLWSGVFYAVCLPLIRLTFTSFWIMPLTTLDVSLNAVIRVSVLLLITYLVDHAATQNRALNHEVQVLQGLLPICSFCKKIRNEDNNWEQLESYIGKHSAAEFSHGLCPDCAKEHYPEFYGDKN